MNNEIMKRCKQLEKENEKLKKDLIIANITSQMLEEVNEAANEEIERLNIELQKLKNKER